MKTKQQTLFIHTLDVSMIDVYYRNAFHFSVPKDIILRLHKVFNIKRGLGTEKTPGIIRQIRDGTRNDITFSDLKRIFKEKWSYIFVPEEKIIKAEKYRMENVKYYGHIRSGGGAEQYSLQRISQYISNNISYGVENGNFIGLLHKKSPWDAAVTVREILNLTLSEFRSIKEPSQRFNYVMEKINGVGVPVFRSHNRNGVMPEKLPDSATFDGLSVISESGRSAAILVNSKIISFERRIVTALALLHSIGIGSNAIALYHNDEYREIKNESFDFVGFLLFDDKEIKQLQEKIVSWEDAKLLAKDYGVSPSFLVWFLFCKSDKERYVSICEERPTSPSDETKKKKSKGGQSLMKAFAHFYPKELLSSNLNKVGEKETANLISFSGDKKDARLFLRNVKREHGL